MYASSTLRSTHMPDLSEYPKDGKEAFCRLSIPIAHLSQHSLPISKQLTDLLQSMRILKQMFRPEFVDEFPPRKDKNTIYFAFARLVGDKDAMRERSFFGDCTKPFEIILSYIASGFKFCCNFTIDDEINFKVGAYPPIGNFRISAKCIGI